MFKIQERIAGGREWYDMIDMPNFPEESDAKRWLDERHSEMVANIMTFRIVRITSSTGPAPEPTK